MAEMILTIGAKGNELVGRQILFLTSSKKEYILSEYSVLGYDPFLRLDREIFLFKKLGEGLAKKMLEKMKNKGVRFRKAPVIEITICNGSINSGCLGGRFWCGYYFELGKFFKTFTTKEIAVPVERVSIFSNSFVQNLS